MKTLLRNALIVTMNENNDVIERGAIAVDGKRAGSLDAFRPI